MKRKTPLVTGQYYHVYNRGVDKRDIFLENADMDRFFQSVLSFNAAGNGGDLKDRLIFEYSNPPLPKLVNIVCYALNANHFHFLLEQVADRGIEEFMQRLGTGYTNYFNIKNKRSGSLFQGVYKSKHVNTDSYMRHLSVYINLNDKIHKVRNGMSISTMWSENPEFPSRTSFLEYIRPEKRLASYCEKGAVLNLFDGVKEYEDFAWRTLRFVQENNYTEDSLESIFSKASSTDLFSGSLGVGSDGSDGSLAPVGSEAPETLPIIFLLIQFKVKE
jgi:REP element-mobilizing transposase RayT